MLLIEIIHGAAAQALPRTVEWAVFCRLIKANDESPFPALSQIEIWGTEG
jgi:hypothetical protein